MTPPAPSMLAGRATSRTTWGCRGRSSSASSTTSNRSLRVDRAEQRGQDRGLAAAGAPGDQERQPGRQHRAQQRLAGRHRPCPGRAARRGRARPGGAPAATGRCRRRRPATARRAAAPRPRPATRRRTGWRRRAAGRRRRRAVGPAAAPRRRRGTAARWARRPAPRSTQTAAGPQTRTSVVRGSRSSSSSGPAPTNSWRSMRSAASTSRSEATPPASARTAAATAAGVVVAAGRGQPGPHAVDQRRVADRLGAGGARVHARLLGSGLRRSADTRVRRRGPAAGTDREVVDGGGSMWTTRGRGEGSVGFCASGAAAHGDRRPGTQLGQHRPGGADQRPAGPREPGAALQPPVQPRLRSHRGEQRQRERPGDLGCVDAAGGRAAHDQLHRGAVLGEHRGHPRPGRARAHVGRHHQHGEVGVGERGDGGLGGVARQVAHDDLAGPPAGLDHRPDAPPATGRPPSGRRTARPSSRGSRDRRRPGAGSAACRAAAGTRPAPTADLRPPQPGDVLGAEHEVQAAAQRVAVDQQGALPRADRGDRHRGRQHRRPGAAATADHGQHRRRRRTSLRRLGQRALTSHGSSSGSTTTCSAPTATACSQSCGRGRPVAARRRPVRAGPARPARSARPRRRPAAPTARSPSTAGPARDRPRAAARMPAAAANRSTASSRSGSLITARARRSAVPSGTGSVGGTATSGCRAPDGLRSPGSAPGCPPTSDRVARPAS